MYAGNFQASAFGPPVVGPGGKATEVFADLTIRLAPLTGQDVHDLITAPHCAPLLFDAQGAVPSIWRAWSRCSTGCPGRP
ncbi:acetate--CoA ligase family protein [Streptomyces werraensis]|uniref:acetate--CoA ligase family protein n=1 Tax=Streptomyces werraensis TaxID=68284 RepID=UPI0033A084A8